MVLHEAFQAESIRGFYSDAPLSSRLSRSAYYPGQQGGLAIWDTIFGVSTPGGKTASTWYAHTSDLPDLGDQQFYPSNVTGSKGITYRYFTGQPTIPFGFGLSYTSFEYSQMVITNPQPQACDWIQVNVTVTNTGSITGDEIIQVYLQQVNATVPAPLIRLVGFQRVTIAAGASVTESFSIDPAYRSVVMDEGFDNIWTPTRLIEAGELIISVGGGQPGFAPFNGFTQTVQVMSQANLDDCEKPNA